MNTTLRMTIASNWRKFRNDKSKVMKTIRKFTGLRGSSNMRKTNIKRLWLTITFAAIAGGFHSTASAEPYTFEGRPSGWFPTFVDRSLVAPCHAKVSVRLSAPRYDHLADDIPMKIEVRAPGVSLQSPPTHTHYFSSKPENLKVETFTVPGSDAGCGGSPWRVRIFPDGRTRESRIGGDFSVSFAGVTIMDIEDAATLTNGNSTTKNIGGSGGLHEGWLEIIGTWNQSIFGFPGPLPVKLNFDLLKPDGSIAAYDTGHSNHEINPCCSGDKLKLRFLIKQHISGQWKLRIKNDSGSDVMTLKPGATLKPACQ